MRRRFPHADITYDAYVAASGAVKLMDFNPVGGTTAPLLFTWEELGLAGGTEAAGASSACLAGSEAAARGAAAADPSGAGAVADGSAVAESQPAAAACSGCCAAQQEAALAEDSAAAEPSDEATSDSVVPSYLEQLRRVQALSLAEQQQQQQPPPPQAAAGERQLSATSAAPACPQPRFELRIIEEPVAMRPATLAYGVPFDFVDGSEGSALDRLMQQAQQAGAQELWAALAAQGGGGGAAGDS